MLANLGLCGLLRRYAGYSMIMVAILGYVGYSEAMLVIPGLYQLVTVGLCWLFCAYVNWLLCICFGSSVTRLTGYCETKLYYYY